MAATGPVRAFLSCAHEDHAWRDRVLAHLGWLHHRVRLDMFDDRQIEPGTRWDPRIKEALGAADVIVLLLSPHFLNSHYCMVDELELALERQAKGAQLFPIVCDHIPLRGSPIGAHQCIPQNDANDLVPLVDWPNPNRPLAGIAERISLLVDEIERDPTRAARSAVAPSPDAPATGTGAWRLPVPPARCLGRAGDVARLTSALLAEQPRPIVILGGAGMGKSTLAREAACRAEVVGRFGARRAWVPLDGAEAPDALLAAVQGALALPATSEPWEGIEVTMRATPGLVVLDNLEAPWDRQERAVEAVLERLAAVPGLVLMASVRGGRAPTKPAWEPRLEAVRLPWPYDRDLLCDIARDVPEDDPLLAEVLTALDGWPLAIELFAAEAADSKGLVPAWRRYARERAAMLDRPGADGDRLSSIDVSLGFSLRSPQMRLDPPLAPDAPARLYAMLGRLPDGMLLADAERLLPGDGDAAVPRLIRTRLASAERDRLRMLAPVREHAGRIDLDPADRNALYTHYLGLAAELRRYFGGEYLGIDLPRLRTELVNLEALLTAAASGADANDVDQREFGSLMLAVGDARGQLGQLALSLADYLQAASVFSKLTSRDPGDVQCQRDLFVSQSKVADVLVAQGDLSSAIPAYEAVLETNKRLAAADPDNAQWQRDLSVSWDKLGGVRQAQGDLQRALDAYTQDMQITAKLAAADPGNALWQRDLSVSWNKLGGVRQAQGDLPGALDAYTASQTIRARLAAADPGNAGWQRDLSISWEKLGGVREAQKDGPGALTAWRAALAISERLARDFPDSVDMQTTQVVHLAGVARHLDPADPAANAEAKALLDRALAVLRPLAESGRLDASRLGWIGWIEQQRAALEEPAPP